MQNTKIFYKTKLSNALIITIGLGLAWGFGIAVGLQNGADISDPRIPLALCVWLVLSSNFLFGFYGELDMREKKFSRVSYFIYREKLALDEIKEIRYQPMFWITSYDKSIFVAGIHDGKQVNLHYFSNRNFDEKTLAQMAYDLKEAAPHVKYDTAAENLVRKYFPTI